MKPPRNLRSLSADALARAQGTWDGRLADEIERVRATDEAYRTALDTALDIEDEIQRRAK